MRCFFPPRHLTLVLSPFRSILPFSSLHSTYYCYCGLFFFFFSFFPLPIIICLTLSAEQDFFCCIFLSFTIFFMIFLPVGYFCPQFLNINYAIGVLHTTQMSRLQQLLVDAVRYICIYQMQSSQNYGRANISS